MTLWKPKGEIRVLVVDDSRPVRDMVRFLLKKEAGITVVGEAVDGADAVAKVLELHPDVVTMDIEMPVMGGFEAIETIMSRHPVPILALTALSGVQTAFTAVTKGALDVMLKPEMRDNPGKLAHKIRTLSAIDLNALRQLGKGSAPLAAKAEGKRQRPHGARVVAIAASTGGPQAIQHILSQLPADFPAPIVVTQHMAEGFIGGMVQWLNATSRLAVKIACNGDYLTPGEVSVNPPQQAMRVSRQGMVLLGERDPRLVYNPSCDTLLTAVADAYGERAIGVILSGMGDDGVMGMESIKNAGGATLAQDAGSSVIFGMNSLALQRGCIDRALPLSEIPGELMALVCGR